MNIHQQFPKGLLNVTLHIYIYIYTKYSAKDARRIGYLSICVLVFEPLQIQGEECPYGLGTLPNETGSTSCHSCPEGCWALNPSYHFWIFHPKCWWNLCFTMFLLNRFSISKKISASWRSPIWRRLARPQTSSIPHPNNAKGLRWFGDYPHGNLMNWPHEINPCR